MSATFRQLGAGVGDLSATLCGSWQLVGNLSATFRQLTGKVGNLSATRGKSRQLLRPESRQLVGNLENAELESATLPKSRHAKLATSCRKVGNKNAKSATSCRQVGNRNTKSATSCRKVADKTQSRRLVAEKSPTVFSELPPPPVTPDLPN